MKQSNLSINNLIAITSLLFMAFAPTSARSSEQEQVVKQLCSTCHSISNIERSSGYNKEQWKTLISYMVDHSSNPQQLDILGEFLANKYPANNDRASKVVDGDIKLQFKYWQVPTLGQRARDPVQGKDGIIWWVGQWGNILGRLDPTSGETKEYTLPAGTYPHSVTLDKNLRPWFLGNKNGTVGYLDLDTETFKVFNMPDEKARDPHTGVFDDNGIFWFTLQHSNMIGKLDPTSGDIQLVSLPTEKSRPYGIKLDSNGTPWVSCNGSNCLIKVDKNSMALKEIKLPNPNSHTRRLAITPDDMVFYVNSGMGKLGR
ncbi:Vgb family protein [Aliiglaciecola lipolytica]|nr:cytochrome C [Aliiglaciecola lipolytica]